MTRTQTPADAMARKVAAELVDAGKGILALDESPATMSKRLEAAGIPATPSTRRDYREILITTPGLSRWISGAILCDETLRQSLRDGTPVPEAVRQAGLHIGIKVDTGVTPLALTDGETVTEGLDGLRGRLEEYRAMGATFAKWRAVFYPVSATERGVRANAHALARYAALCQEAGVVPVVEPEVVMDGGHSIDRCAKVSSRALAWVFSELACAGVDPRGLVLKPNMVTAGSGYPEANPPEQVAARTLSLLRQHVPASVPGIAFLSGGQTNPQACANLAAINQQAIATGGAPWKLTFSFGRALVSDALAAWGGRRDNEALAQQALAANCERASLAATAGRSEVLARG